MATIYEELTKTPEDKKLYQREKTVVEFTEKLAEIMNRNGIGKGKLSKMLGIKIEDVELLMDGNPDITIGEMSDALFAMGKGIYFVAYDLERK